MPHSPISLAGTGWYYHYYSDAKFYMLFIMLENFGKDTFGGEASYIWVDGTTAMCTIDVNSDSIPDFYGVYAVSAR